MKLLSLIILVLFGLIAQAEEKFIMNYSNEDLTKIIEVYSKASGQKFVIDSTVRGKITILNPEPITLKEVFNQISTALALNGFAIFKQGEAMTIRNARSAQRSSIEVSTELPSANPERMATWIYTVKNMTAHDLMHLNRLLTSMYGEMAVANGTNQLIITDFTSSLNKVSEMLKQIDRKADPSVQKLASTSKEQSEKDRAENKKNRKNEALIVPPPPQN